MLSGNLAQTPEYLKFYFYFNAEVNREDNLRTLNESIYNLKSSTFPTEIPTPNFTAVCKIGKEPHRPLFVFVFNFSGQNFVVENKDPLLKKLMASYMYIVQTYSNHSSN